jgi:hypothetical protein
MINQVLAPIWKVDRHHHVHQCGQLLIQFWSPEQPEMTAESDKSTGTKRTPETRSTPTSSRKKIKRDNDITEFVHIAKNIAATYNVAKERRQKSNNTFVEYILTRLDEMGPDEAQKKRKPMLVILEGLQD